MNVSSAVAGPLGVLGFTLPAQHTLLVYGPYTEPDEVLSVVLAMFPNADREIVDLGDARGPLTVGYQSLLQFRPTYTRRVVVARMDDWKIQGPGRKIAWKADAILRVAEGVLTVEKDRLTEQDIAGLTGTRIHLATGRVLYTEPGSISDLHVRGLLPANLEDLCVPMEEPLAADLEEPLAVPVPSPEVDALVTLLVEDFAPSEPVETALVVPDAPAPIESFETLRWEEVQAAEPEALVEVEPAPVLEPEPVVETPPEPTPAPPVEVTPEFEGKPVRPRKVRAKLPTGDEPTT